MSHHDEVADWLDAVQPAYISSSDWSTGGDSGTHGQGFLLPDDGLISALGFVIYYLCDELTAACLIITDRRWLIWPFRLIVTGSGKCSMNRSSVKIVSENVVIVNRL